MKNPIQFLAFLSLMLLMAACQKESLQSLAPQQATPDHTYLDEAGLRAALGIQELDLRDYSSSLVYTMSNDASGNKIYAYNIADNGSLTSKGSYPTTGMGTGTDMGNQGALTTGLGGHLVYAVNPGSNDMSVFYALTDGSLSLKEKVATGGTQPVSVTEHNGIVYVLNAGAGADASSIVGFGYDNQAKLVQIPGSKMEMSASDASQATQISFSADGKVLVVTDKGTNQIHSFPMSQYKPTTMYSYTTTGTAPSGFAMGKNNMMVVTDAGNSASNTSSVSNYRINSNGTISLLDGPLTTDASYGSGALVMSKYGSSLYTMNPSSNNMSSLISVSGLGKLSLSGSLTVTAMAAGTGPKEAAISADAKHMYVMGGQANTLTSFNVNANGSLTPIGVMTDLPDFSTGLIVR
jgi:6-phosphogluconolactonase (cycloisomerase 2 family)